VSGVDQRGRSVRASESQRGGKEGFGRDFHFSFLELFTEVWAWFVTARDDALIDHVKEM
jgi:hypothetical protein